MFRRLTRSLHRGLTENQTQLEPSADDPRLRPWTFPTLAPSALLDRLDRWAESRRRWTVQSRDADTLHLTRRTLLGFVDDVHIQVEPDTAGGCRVNAESRSRIGKGDLGQNRRNLLEIRAAASR